MIFLFWKYSFEYILSMLYIVNLLLIFINSFSTSPPLNKITFPSFFKDFFDQLRIFLIDDTDRSPRAAMICV